MSEAMTAFAPCAGCYTARRRYNCDSRAAFRPRFRGARGGYRLPPPFQDLYVAREPLVRFNSAKFSRLSAFVLVCTFVVLSLIYGFTTPLWEAPDELGHFLYVAHLVQQRSLPLQQIGHLGEAHQPPLYYAVAALPTSLVDLQNPTGSFLPNPNFIWAGQGGTDLNIAIHGSAETFPFEGWSLALHLARATSTVLSTLTLVFILAIGREIFPLQKTIGVAGAALVALNPQFLFISGSVNNDNLLTLATTGGLWQLLHAIKRPYEVRSWIYVGLWLAIGILTKLSALVLVAVAGLVLTICAGQYRSFRLWWRGALALLLPILILTGWWFLRNQQLYGDLLGWAMYEQVFAVNLRSGPLQPQDFRDLFSTQFRSFWGVFGWMNVSAPAWYYGFVRLLSFLGIAGIVTFLIRFRYTLTGQQKVNLLVLGGMILAQETYMMIVISKCNASCYQGRYLFPVVGPLMLFLATGLYALVPPRLRIIILGGIVATLSYAAVTFPFTVIEPAYAIVPLAKRDIQQVSQKTWYDFNQQFQLLGYDVENRGDQIAVTMYWQAAQKPDFDYSAFVHLIDQNDQIIAQDDHAPGSDVNYLPSKWLKDDIVADKHYLEIPGSLPQAEYRLRIGLYNWSTGQQLPVFLDGEAIGTYLVLEERIYSNVSK